MTYLALDRARLNAMSTWDWLPLRRVMSIRREPNTLNDHPLLALSAHRGVELRPVGGGRQLPAEESIANCWVVQPDDLVFNPMWALEGGVAVSHLRGAVSPAYRVYRLSKRLDPRFIHHFMRSRTAIEQYRLLVRGITTFDRSVTRDDLEAMPVPIPALVEQKAIANYLDAETARIDALIAKRQQMLALLDERVKSIVNAPFGSQIIYGLDGRPLGLVGVVCVRLGQVSAIHSGLTLDGGRDAGPTALTYPYLRVANVQDGSLDLSELKEVTVSRATADRCRLEVGDVLMTEGGDPDKLGRGAVWPGDVSPCLHQNHIFAVRPGPRLLPKYLALITRTSYARAYFEMTASKTTGIASTSTTKIASFRIPVPTISEQEEIVRSVEHRVGDTDRLYQSVGRQVDLLLERRQALIAAAVSGNMRVPGSAA